MKELQPYIDMVYRIIGAAMEVHSQLKWGLQESVYQEALHLELLWQGIENDREKEVYVYYKNHRLEKRYKMDMVVGDIILELKSVFQVLPAHRAQLCNYLRLTNAPLGLLINFGEEKLVTERWAYDPQSNRCFLVDRNLKRVFDANYDYLLVTK